MKHISRKLVICLTLFFIISLSIIFIIYHILSILSYIGFFAFVLCLFLSYEFRNSELWKTVFFNLGIIMLLSGLSAAYFTWSRTSEIKEEPLEGGNYYVADGIRGYAAGANVKKRVRKTYEGKVLYDVKYTTDRYGLRVAPHDLTPGEGVPGKNYGNVMFFGDSFTYGEGLNDNETLPYLFEELSGGRYRAYNFGFHGYGTQQMLRIIETGLLQKIVSDQRPMIVVYEALIQHIDRASGKLIWDAKVPRYRLSAAGIPEYTGTFADDPSLEKNLEFSKSVSNPGTQLLAQVGLTKLIGANRTQGDIELFIQMVLKAKNLVKTRYNAKFYVFVWPFDDKDADKVINLLKNNGIDVITINQITNKYNDHMEKYLIKYDHHPTKYANERIAHYLLDYIN
jgi:hypothetical protein